MQHLLELLGLPREPEDGAFPAGLGRVIVWNRKPAAICLRKADAGQWRTLVKNALREGGVDWTYSNHITLRRGPYIVCHVMEESVHETPKVFVGRFVDLLADGYPVISQKTVLPGDGALLYDLDRLEKGRFSVIATAARIVSAEIGDSSLCLRAQAADQVLVFIRLRLPFVPAACRTSEADLFWQYDAASQTMLVSFRSGGKEITLWADAQR